MSGRDDWGRDPGVRAARELFGLLEARQRELVKRLGLSPFDPRLRRWREQARAVFDRSWGEAARAGRPWSADEGAERYAKGFVRVLAAAGVDVGAENGGDP